MTEIKKGLFGVLFDFIGAVSGDSETFPIYRALILIIIYIGA